MKLKNLLMVSIVLLTIISMAAVSAADNSTVDEITVADSGDLEVESPVDDINTDGDDIEEVAVSDDVNKIENSKLGASADDVLANPVDPTYDFNIDLPMSGSSYVLQWGQPIVVSANFTDATGDVVITFAGETYNVELVDGAFKYSITKYSKIANNQKLQVVYNGDDKYNTATIDRQINIQLNDISVNAAQFGLSAFADINLYNATGNVSVTVNNKKTIKSLENGKAIIEFTDYVVGRNTVTFAYDGDENYNSITKAYTIDVATNIDAPNIYNLETEVVTVHMGSATGNVTFTFNGNAYVVPIENGIASQSLTDYKIGSNTVKVEYSGDENFASFSQSKTFTVKNKENVTIYSSVYKNGDKNAVIVAIPWGTGTVNVTINGKQEELELIDGIATYAIGKDDVIDEINVSYGGNGRLNAGNSSDFIYLINNIVNNDNYMYYFNQKDGGKLFNFINDGDTLDFQGKIINPDQSLNVFFDVSKPVNIISTTGDAYIDLNTTAGSLLGENPGNRFTISNGGSGTNMTGIDLHNTQLWLFNTHHVVLDRVSNVIEDQRVGSGVGATSIRANSTWVTVKNSYFYTRNNGGSSSLVIAWADYCTFDNNTVVVEGNVGNMIYLTTYNVDIPDGVLANVYNNITNNRIKGPSTPAAIAWGLAISGVNNYVANNYIDYSGTGINQQWGQGDFINNTYTGNVLVGGASANFLPNSIVYNNTISGSASTGINSVFYNNTVAKVLTVGEGSEVYNSTVGGLTVSGTGAIVRDSVINGPTALSAAKLQILNNTFTGDNLIKFDKAISNNITLADNEINGYIEFANKNAKDNKIVNNNITTSKNYAVDLKTYTNTNNNISNNILNSANGFGNDAVKFKAGGVTVDNYQNESSNISVIVNPVNVVENTTVTINASNNKLSQVKVFIGNKEYTVDLIDGIGTLELNDLEAGAYNILVVSADKEIGGKNTSSITITKNNASITVDGLEVTQFVPSDITVTISGATGSVILTVNGTDYTSELVDGVAIFEVPELAVGNYAANITYSGNYKYFNANTTATLVINKNKITKIIASNLTENKIANKYSVTLVDYFGEAVAGEELVLAINGETFKAISDENGVAVFDISLKMGSYPAVITFAGNENYDGSDASAVINVVDSTSITVVTIYGDLRITAVLKDAYGNAIPNAVLYYTLNGGDKNSVKTNDNGEFTINVLNNCLVNMTYEGSEFAKGSNAFINLKNIAPVKKGTQITVDKTFTRTAVDFPAGEKGYMFYFTLKDETGKVLANKEAKIGVSGKIYTVKTDKNGKAGLMINLANANVYTYAISFLGDDEYKASFAVSKLTVVKKAVTITPAKTSYTFKSAAKSKVITATLKSTNKFIPAGKKVTLTVGGKTYSAVVAKNGKISLNIAKLTKKGTYKVTIKYAGDGTYKAAASKTITVKIA